MKRVILVVRDGWGYRKECTDNAICQAHPPFTEEIMKQYPHTLLDASGEHVGLEKGNMGNSEVGHLTMGAGRAIYQPLVRILKSISDGSFYARPAFLEAISHCKKNNSTLHLIGLFQTEGVHSHLKFLIALLDLCKKEHFTNVIVHPITDGRDAPVTNSITQVTTVLHHFKEIGFGRIGMLSGRYYAMDRDKRWDRTRKAYEALVQGKGVRFEDLLQQLRSCHAGKETDEFIVPRVHKDYQGVHAKDAIIFFNHRTDRPRQLTKAIVEKEFEGWQREPLDVFYVGMTQYYSPMNAKVAFEDALHQHMLGQILSEHGIKQLRLAETEKYGHVTYFFNGQIEAPFPGEDRIMIPSPKVATYDLQPEMSANQITDQLIEKIREEKYEFILVNYANADMVGHTGISEVIRAAVKTVDDCLHKVVPVALEHEYIMLILADHGNAEDQTAEWRTSHTTNRVPCVLVAQDTKGIVLAPHHGLKDVAPTILKMMGLPTPKEMTGESFVR